MTDLATLAQEFVTAIDDAYTAVETMRVELEERYSGYESHMQFLRQSVDALMEENADLDQQLDQIFEAAGINRASYSVQDWLELLEKLRS